MTQTDQIGNCHDLSGNGFSENGWSIPPFRTGKRQQNNREIRICSCSYMLFVLILACIQFWPERGTLICPAYKIQLYIILLTDLYPPDQAHERSEKQHQNLLSKLSKFCFNQKKMILAIQFIETFSLGKFLFRTPQVSDDLFNISYQRNTSYLSPLLTTPIPFLFSHSPPAQSDYQLDRNWVPKGL